MSQATGSRLQFSYVAETVPGTTPTTPAFKATPLLSTDLQFGRGLITDASLRADRMKRYSRLGNHSVGGSIDVNYAPAVFDDLLASAMFSTWNSNVAKVGTTQTSYTLEVGATDINQYRAFKGCVPSVFSLTVPSGNTMVTGKFEFMGMTSTLSPTSLDADGATAPVDGDPFVHLDGSFSLDGSPIAYFTGIQVKIDNQVQANYALGSPIARSVTAGMANITGQVTAYFESALLANLFINETDASLMFTLNSGASSQTWSMPVVQFNAANIAISGDGPQIITLPFEALYDSVSGTVLTVTRV